MTKSKEEIANIVADIREKIKKNPDYTKRRCDHEYQNDIKKYGFDNGGQYAIFLVENDVVIDSTEVNREITKKTAKNAGFETRIEYDNYIARKGGYESRAQRRREYTYDIGRHLPM